MLLKQLSVIKEQNALITHEYDDLTKWLEATNDNVRQLLTRPAKLHIAPASLDIRQLEVRLHIAPASLDIKQIQIRLK